MRLFCLVLLVANLLLRGAAVPCPEATSAEPSAHCHRPHVHVAGGQHRHARAHNPGSAVARCDDASDHAEADGASRGSSPHHDRDAVYLDDDGLILATDGRTSPARPAADWLAIPASCGNPAAAPVWPQPRRIRSPGDGTATIRALLPHLLRV